MKTSTRLIGIVIAVLVGLGLFAAGFLLTRNGWSLFGSGPGMMGGSMGYDMMGGVGYGGILSILFWVVVIGLGVWLIVNLVSHANQPPLSNPPALESPLDILKKRYARGEITKEQFNEMRHDLNA